jgi:DNA-binding transcriptional regulator YbjK
VTSASTPKGERRRQALIVAAAELLLEGGFDSVRHRAVAQRAGLPLAATTYYFDSLEDLIVSAVEYSARNELAKMRARIDDVSRRKRGSESLADLLVEFLVGPTESGGDRDYLVSRYERFVASARHPELRAVHLRIRAELDEMLTDLLVRSGRQIAPAQLHRLVAVVDGAIVSELAEVDSDPRGAAKGMLLQVLDSLAPAQ